MLIISNMANQAWAEQAWHQLARQTVQEKAREDCALGIEL